jgi:hypothetical protein
VTRARLEPPAEEVRLAVEEVLEAGSQPAARKTSSRKPVDIKPNLSRRLDFE